MDIKRLVILHGEKPIIAVIFIIAVYVVMSMGVRSQEIPNIQEKLDEAKKRYEQVGPPPPDDEQAVTKSKKLAEFKKMWFGSVGAPESYLRSADFWPVYGRPPVLPPKIDIRIDPPTEVIADSGRGSIHVQWMLHANHKWQREVNEEGEDELRLYQVFPRKSKRSRILGYIVTRKDLATGKQVDLNDGRALAVDEVFNRDRKPQIKGRTETGDLGYEEPGMPSGEGMPPAEMDRRRAAPRAPAGRGGMPPDEGLPPGEGYDMEGMDGERRPEMTAEGFIWNQTPTSDFAYADYTVEEGKRYTYRATVVVEGTKDKTSKRPSLEWSDEARSLPNLHWVFEGISAEVASIWVYKFVELKHLGGFWQELHIYARLGDTIGFRAEKQVFAIDEEKAKKDGLKGVEELSIQSAPKYLKRERGFVDFSTGAVVVDLFKDAGLIKLGRDTGAGGKATLNCLLNEKARIAYLGKEGRLQEMWAESHSKFVENFQIELPSTYAQKRARQQGGVDSAYDEGLPGEPGERSRAPRGRRSTRAVEPLPEERGGRMRSRRAPRRRGGEEY